MGHADPKRHWEDVYSKKAESDVSWFQAEPATSIEFIGHCGAGKDAAIIDIGGGESRLVDRLLDAGYSDVTVLDVSGHALEYTKARLGARAGAVQWIVADITDWKPPRRYRLWHDRAVLHFLTAAGRSQGLCQSAARSRRSRRLRRHLDLRAGRAGKMQRPSGPALFRRNACRRARAGVQAGRDHERRSQDAPGRGAALPVQPLSTPVEQAPMQTRSPIRAAFLIDDAWMSSSPIG